MPPKTTLPPTWWGPSAPHLKPHPLEAGHLLIGVFANTERIGWRLHPDGPEGYVPLPPEYVVGTATTDDGDGSVKTTRITRIQARELVYAAHPELADETHRRDLAVRASVAAS